MFFTWTLNLKANFVPYARLKNLFWIYIVRDDVGNNAVTLQKPVTTPLLCKATPKAGFCISYYMPRKNAVWTFECCQILSYLYDMILRQTCEFYPSEL